MTFKAPQQPPPKEELASYHLHKLLCGKTPGRSIDTIHASDVTKSDFCARRVAIMRDGNVKPYPESLGTCQRVVFRIGRDLERSVQMWFANLGFLMGNWRCGSCATLHCFCLKPKACGCGFTKFHYKEVRLIHEVSHISGGVDMLLKLPSFSFPRIYELKSMDKNVFQGLKGPLGDHLERTQLYLDLAANDEFSKNQVDLGLAGILYVSKGGYGRQTNEPSASWGLPDMKYSPFREYLVKPNPEGVKHLHAKAQPATDYAAEGGDEDGNPKALPDGICGSPMEKRAQACEVMGPCFK